MRQYAAGGLGIHFVGNLMSAAACARVVPAPLAACNGGAAPAGQSLRIAMTLWSGPTEAGKGFRDGWAWR